MPLNIDFQTCEANEAADAELELAMSILKTAESVYIAAVQKTYPPGCHFDKQHKPRATAPMELIQYYEGSTRAICKYRNTGRRVTLEMGVGYIYSHAPGKLTTYAYRRVDIEPALEKRVSVSYNVALEE